MKVGDASEGKILTDADIRKMTNNDRTPPASPEKPELASPASPEMTDRVKVISNTQNYTAPASPTLARSESVIDGSSFSSAASVAP